MGSFLNVAPQTRQQQTDQQGEIIRESKFYSYLSVVVRFFGSLHI